MATNTAPMATIRMRISQRSSTTRSVAAAALIWRSVAVASRASRFGPRSTMATAVVSSWSDRLASVACAPSRSVAAALSWSPIDRSCSATGSSPSANAVELLGDARAVSGDEPLDPLQRLREPVGDVGGGVGRVGQVRRRRLAGRLGERLCGVDERLGQRQPVDDRERKIGEVVGQRPDRFHGIRDEPRRLLGDVQAIPVRQREALNEHERGDGRDQGGPDDHPAEHRHRLGPLLAVANGHAPFVGHVGKVVASPAGERVVAGSPHRPIGRRVSGAPLAASAARERHMVAPPREPEA